MATDIAGLFGLTPESYQMAQEKQAQEQALQYAGMNPFQQANYGLFMSGRQLGGAVGQALGAQDPMLQQISRQQAILKEINPSDPLSLARGIQTAQQAGIPQLAVALSGKLQDLQKNQADIAKSMRETMPPEQKLAQALADNSFERGTPEWNKTYGTELKRLTTKEATDKSEIKEVGVAENTREPVYTYKTSATGVPQQVVFKTDAQGNQTIVPYTGGVDRTTAKVTATASQKAEEAGLTKLAELDAKRVSDANIASDKAQEQLGTLQQLAKVPQNISGAGAQMRVGALRVFSTMGLTSPKDNEALANADTFNSLTRSNVLSFIKQLGVNPTDTDRNFAESIGPALEKGTKTNQDLINYLTKKAQWVQEQASGLESHFYANKGSLKGYKSPFVSGFNAPSTAGKYSNLSDAELQARIKALQSK